MALSRLSDSQKIDLVERYRRGESSAELAVAFGCSPNTVSRTVKAALSPADYQQLKQQRGRSSSSTPPSGLAAVTTVLEVTVPEVTVLEGMVPEVMVPEGAAGEATADDVTADDDTLEANTLEANTEILAQSNATVAVPTEVQGEIAGLIETADLIPADDQSDPGNQLDTEDQIDPEDQSAAEAPVAVLAIDDADDFASDDASDDLDTDTDTDSDTETELDTDDSFVGTPAQALELNHDPVQVHPLVVAALPESLYMLVDNTVELQAKPLKDFPELGQLPPEEQDRQALLLFSNPRQAKRHCGRTQRVIKMPDPAVFERTAPYLLVQGISRLVLEGTLYSLPGS